MGLPLVDLTGGLIATDGSTLVGYYGDGTPRGNPVVLYPVQGAVFDLSIAEKNGVAVLLYKCGFLATYLTGMLSRITCINRLYPTTAGQIWPMRLHKQYDV